MDSKLIYDTSGTKREIINSFREAFFYSSENKILHPYYFESEIVATVKSHIINIYSRLQVNNRFAVIEAARNYRIL